MPGRVGTQNECALSRCRVLPEVLRTGWTPRPTALALSTKGRQPLRVAACISVPAESLNAIGDMPRRRRVLRTPRTRIGNADYPTRLQLPSMRGSQRLGCMVPLYRCATGSHDPCRAGPRSLKPMASSQTRRAQHRQRFPSHALSHASDNRWPRSRMLEIPPEFLLRAR